MLPQAASGKTGTMASVTNQPSGIQNRMVWSEHIQSTVIGLGLSPGRRSPSGCCIIQERTCLAHEAPYRALSVGFGGPLRGPNFHFNIQQDTQMGLIGFCLRGIDDGNNAASVRSNVKVGRPTRRYHRR